MLRRRNFFHYIGSGRQINKAIYFSRHCCDGVIRSIRIFHRCSTIGLIKCEYSSRQTLACGTFLIESNIVEDTAHIGNWEILRVSVIAHLIVQSGIFIHRITFRLIRCAVHIIGATMESLLCYVQFHPIHKLRNILYISGNGVCIVYTFNICVLRYIPCKRAI